MSKLTEQILAAYLTHKVNAILTDDIDCEFVVFDKGTILTLAGLVPKNSEWYLPDGNGEKIDGPVFMHENAYLHSTSEFKLLLRPLSSLTIPITHNGETFVPIEWFEIGDDENTSLEYDHGNIKIIKQLEDISRIGMFQFKYLPFGVVQKLIEWHFDLWNLLESGDALPITANQEKS